MKTVYLGTAPTRRCRNDHTNTTHDYLLNAHQITGNISYSYLKRMCMFSLYLLFSVTIIDFIYSFAYIQLYDLFCVGEL